MWSTPGRLIYAALLIGMFALAGTGSIVGIVVFFVLLTGCLLVAVADERKRARLFYEDDDESHAAK